MGPAHLMVMWASVSSLQATQPNFDTAFDKVDHSLFDHGNLVGWMVLLRDAFAVD